MNVLFVTGMFPPDIGGPATYTDVMASELQERGHSVRVVTLSDELDPDGVERSFDITRIRRGRNFLGRTVAVGRTVRRLSDWSDIVYAQGLQLELGAATDVLQAPVVARVVGDKAWEVSYQRGWVHVPFQRFQDGSFGLRPEVLRQVRSWSLGRLDAIVAATNYFAGHIRGWGIPDERIHRIDNFVKEPEDLPTIGDLPGDSGRTIATVGRLVAWKRLDILLEALAGGPDADLVVVGDGPERERWEEQARDLEIADRTFFVGRKAHSETLAYLEAADVFALPSTWESFSIVVPEAMSVGTPVVVSDIGGPNEIITHEHDGLLVPPEDPAALSRALGTVLRDETLARELSDNAYETLEEYSLTNVATEVEELLGRLAA